MDGNEKEDEGGATSKTAFIVTPIGGDGTEVRRATDGLIYSVLRPSLEDAGFKGVSSHEEDDLGSISGKVINHLINDDLIIVNLTLLNANVMYELGIRHATGKPVILIAQNGTALPFDTQDQRTIFYNNDMMGVIELKKRLDSLLGNPEKLANNDGNPVFTAAKDNLVNKALEDKLNSQVISDGEKGLVEIILGRMDNFENKVMTLVGGNKKSAKRNVEAEIHEAVSKSDFGTSHVITPQGSILIGMKHESDYDLVRDGLKAEGIEFQDIGDRDGCYLVGVLKKDASERESKIHELIDAANLPF